MHAWSVLLISVGFCVVVDVLQWGFVPTFSKTPTGDGLPLMINARAEGVSNKPSFRHAMKHGQRCVVPTSGFYEWHKTTVSGTSKKLVQPYLVLHSDDEERVMMLAGIYEIWREGTEEESWSFTVLTRGPSKELEWLHDRMPVILDGEEEVDGWLSGSVDVEKVASRQRGEREGLKWVKMEKELDKVLNEDPTRGIGRWFAKGGKKSLESSNKCSGDKEGTGRTMEMKNLGGDGKLETGDSGSGGDATVQQGKVLKVNEPKDPSTTTASDKHATSSAIKTIQKPRKTPSKVKSPVTSKSQKRIGDYFKQ